MGWDEPTLEVNALIPAQLAVRQSKDPLDRVTESNLVDFEVRGTNLTAGADNLRLILVRRDPRIHYLANQGEVSLGGLRPAEVIPMINVKTDSAQTAKAQAMIRERAPGAYDLIAFRSPKTDAKGVATNEVNVLRSALVILEPPPQT
ncbi:MAG TPA: hypothetical protein VHM70_25125 [Polyangiaceae bacterium]|jgi:hypothetical protein|nr:hypothetical protein [Polyangiaceae bacterium]